MDTLELLGVALGLGTLAGINLYLTVFVTGLTIQQGWITLLPQYEQLNVLADPVIIIVSGVLFCLEFFADKVPWVDSLWDSVHTFIRPIGGAMVAIVALGDVNPVYDVMVGLLAGGMALTTHGAKAGTRLLVNASPEPFSNIGLSLAEDVAVVGGLALIYHYPIAALCLAVCAVGVAIWLAPRIFRAAFAMMWFLWRRMTHAFGVAPSPGELPELPAELDIAMFRARGEDAILDWAAPCVAGPGAPVRKNTFGWLLHSHGEESGLDFASGSETPRMEPVVTEGRKAVFRRGLVCDRVVIYEKTQGAKQTFLFDRSRRDVAIDLVRLINTEESKPELATIVSV
jgi:Domain of unknown function (DUF4126)